MLNLRSTQEKMSRLDTFLLDDVSLWKTHFHKHGYCILRNVFDEAYVLNEAISGCKALVDELANRLLLQNYIHDTCNNAPFDTRLIELCKNCPDQIPNLFRKELHRPQFFPLLCHQNVLKVVRHLLSPDVDAIRIYPNYSCRPKTKSPIHDVVWHQDAGLRADGGPNTASVDERLDAFGIGSVVNCWTPLVEVTRENGAMKFIVGSHHRGILEHRLLGSYSGCSENGETLTKYISKHDVECKSQTVPAGTYKTGVNPDLIKDDLKNAVDIECSPGDLVLFNNLLIHRGGVNLTSKIRWSFDWRFQDASKDTFRKEKGHIVSIKTDRGNNYNEHIPRTPNEWANLELM